MPRGNSAMSNLDHYEKAIIHFLSHSGDSTINEVSEGLKISWATAKSRLFKLKNLGYVLEEKEGEVTYWKLNE